MQQRPEQDPHRRVLFAGCDRSATCRSSSLTHTALAMGVLVSWAIPKTGWRMASIG
jgi:hypothetical protein